MHGLYFLSIGLAAAQALGRSGAHVVVSSRRQANVDKAVSLLRSENIQVTGTTCNVGNREDREKLINMVSVLFFKTHIHIFGKDMLHLFSSQTLEQCGGIDILVSNAAVNPFFGNILESTDEVWTKVRPSLTNHFKKNLRTSVHSCGCSVSQSCCSSVNKIKQGFG